MHMAAAAAARGARGSRSWSSPSAVLSSNRVLLPSPDGATVAATVRFTHGAGGKRNRAVLCFASGGGGGTGPPRDGEWEPADSSWDGGRLVDEGMATLRRRIREVRAVAASGPDEEEEEEEEEEEGVDLFVGGGDGLPREWTELERRHHGSYVAGVRVLQAFLMRARPGLGAGVVALALLGVPASVLLVSAQLIQAVDAIMSAVMNGRM